ncbi:Beta-glucosidase 15 -like protein [Gossypium arboreum]|uniref:Beta-glucosidase 15-like protein n=1 Tax=Gossypium arboreum TaxID=29729 RepID=A0A0B0NF46_GOSAR|nr:Beta-glucosidase 15 -like protein [Gossypium arboreum]
MAQIRHANRANASHQSLLLGFHSTHRRRTNITPSGRRRAINDQIFANEGRNYGNLARHGEAAHELVNVGREVLGLLMAFAALAVG